MEGLLDSYLDAVREQLAGARGQRALTAWLAHEHGAQHEASLAFETFAHETAFAQAAGDLVLHACGLDALDLGPWGWTGRSSSAKAGADLASRLARLSGRPLAQQLGWLYQRSIDPAVRSRIGAFYTDETLVELLLDRASVHAGRRMIDPACGGGAIVVAAAARMRRQLAGEGLAVGNIAAEVARCVAGRDINPVGVLLTRAGLLLELSGEIRSSRAVPQLDIAAGNSLAGDATLLGRFECVVANPPYAKVASASLCPELRERYEPVLHGHPNLYTMFWQLGIELLAPGGHVAMITPASFVSGRYFHRLRSFMREMLDIGSFDTFTARTGMFEGVQQEVLVTAGRRSADQRAHIEIALHGSALVIERRIDAPVGAVLLEAFDGSFLVSADPLAHRLAKAMQGGPLLGSAARVRTGPVVWNRLKELIEDEVMPGTLPLLWSNGVRSMTWSGPGNRQGLAKALHVTERTRALAGMAPAVLVKRLTSLEERRRLVATRIPDAVAEAGYFAENHVNVIEGDSEMLDVIELVLASTAADQLFRALNGNTQVSATELRCLPLPAAPWLARRRAEHAGLIDQEWIDAVIAEAYGFDEALVAELAERA